MKVLFMISAVLILAIGCGRTKSAQDVSQETPQIELTDNDEYASENDNPDALVESALNDAGAPAESSPVDDPTLAEAGSELNDSSSDAVAEDSSPVISNATPDSSPVTLTDGEGEYTVQKNETLMMVAFKIYGDYSKWKIIANKNPRAVRNGIAIAGSKIKYALPSETFNWNPEGRPYLIRTGDTLGGISSSVYGTTKKWKSIWNNNRPLIKDPNKIFAGFTIYCLESGKVATTDLNKNLEL